MTETLTVISLLGVAQGAVITWLLTFHTDKKQPGSGLVKLVFLACTLAMLLITVVNAGWVREVLGLKLAELFITYSSGPLILLFVDSQIQNKTSTIWRTALHFLPALGAPVLACLGIYRGILPAMVFLQGYCLIAAIRYYRASCAGKVLKGSPFRVWIPPLLLFFFLLALAQWVRFSFSDIERLRLIVPAVASMSFYLMTLAGFRHSAFLGSKREKKGDKPLPIEDDGLDLQLGKLMQEDGIYQNPDLTLTRLAADLDCHPNYLSAYIRSKHNQGFTDYINALRVQKAEELLLDPEMAQYTIEAIAKASGFHSRSAFYQAFKDHTGLTPGAFKKEKLSG